MIILVFSPKQHMRKDMQHSVHIISVFEFIFFKLIHNKMQNAYKQCMFYVAKLYFAYVMYFEQSDFQMRWKKSCF